MGSRLHRCCVVQYERAYTVISDHIIRRQIRVVLIVHRSRVSAAVFMHEEHSAGMELRKTRHVVDHAVDGHPNFLVGRSRGDFALS